MPADVSRAVRIEAIVVAGTSAAVWFALARAKTRIALPAGSAAVQADAAGSFYSAYVASGILVAAVVGWFAAWVPVDPIIALLVAILLLWQGVYGVRVGTQMRDAS